MPQSDEERFWAQVDRRGEPGCWPWRGRDTYGIGKFLTGLAEGEDDDPNGENSGEDVRASEYAFVLTNGPVPDGHVLRARCVTTTCVNPAHFEVAARQEDHLHYPTAAELAELRKVETYLPG